VIGEDWTKVRNNIFLEKMKNNSHFQNLKILYVVSKLKEENYEESIESILSYDYCCGENK